MKIFIMSTSLFLIVLLSNFAMAQSACGDHYSRVSTWLEQNDTTLSSGPRDNHLIVLTKNSD